MGLTHIENVVRTALEDSTNTALADAVKDALNRIGALSSAPSDLAYTKATPPPADRDEVSELTDVQRVLDFLVYDWEERNFVPATIGSFSIDATDDAATGRTNIPGVQCEVGSLISAVYCTWSASGTGVTSTAVSNNSEGPLSLSETGFKLNLDTPIQRMTPGSSVLAISTDADSKGGTASSTASLYFRFRVYGGATANPIPVGAADFLGADADPLSPDIYASVSGSPSNEYMFYAFEASLGAATDIVFEEGGDPVDMIHIADQPHTNATGNVTATYRVFRSRELFSGARTITGIPDTPRIYSGVVSGAPSGHTFDASFLASLPQQAHRSSIDNFGSTLNLPAGSYFYVAIPVSNFSGYTFWDAPSGGFPFDVTEIGDIPVTDPRGGPDIVYKLWRTTNDNLGSGVYIEIRD
jgi:hypothetical protein